MNQEFSNFPNGEASTNTSLRNARDRARRRQETTEQREERLRVRREGYRRRRQQETSDERQVRLALQRERYARRRQEETPEQHQHRLDVARSRHRSLQHFHADLLTPLDHCRLCHCLMFSDRAKQVSNSVLTDICPIALPPDVCVETVVVCSKCYSQLSKSAWPCTSFTNNLLPDEIPAELAILTPDEVRTISLVCPFLKVVILPGGQFGEEGSVIHFPFPVQHVISRLPSPLEESELILSAVGVADRQSFQSLLQQLDQHRVHHALLWLLSNNPLYASISITNQPISNANLALIVTTVCNLSHQTHHQLLLSPVSYLRTMWTQMFLLNNYYSSRTQPHMSHFHVLQLPQSICSNITN